MQVTFKRNSGTVIDGLSVNTRRPQAITRPMDRSEDLHCPEELRPLSSSTLASDSQDRDFVERNNLFHPAMMAPGFSPAGDCDEAFEVFREWIGWTGDPIVRLALPAGETRKTVIINDLHVPDHDEDSIRQLIANEAADTDELVIAGDFATMFAWSRFPKFAQSHTAKEEIITAVKVLRLLSEAFPSIKLFGGNHDARFLKWLVLDKGMTPEMLSALDYMNPGFASPLAFMAKGLPNVEILKPVQCENAEFSFFYQFGDFVAGHAEIYSKIANRASTNFNHWLKSFAEPMGLVKGYRCVGQAHTHQAGTVFGDYGTWCFEMGCLCNLESYVGNARIITPRPWCKGYTRVIQDAVTGRTDINLSRFVHTGKF